MHYQPLINQKIAPKPLWKFNTEVAPNPEMLVCSAIHPSVCPSCYLLNHWRNSTKLATSIPLMVRVWRSSILFLCVHPSVRQSSVHLSVTLSPSKLQGRIQPNLLHHFPSWLGCARAMLFFHVSISPCARAAFFFCVSVHRCVRRPSICLSCYLLLNYWAEFNQTCYITSPHSKGVQEQHFFLCIHCPSICPSCYLLLNHRAEFNQTCYITSPHGKGV